MKELQKIFKCRYSISDGYAGKDRQQSFNVCVEYLPDDANELDNFFEENMIIDFMDSISPQAENKDDFIEWAKEEIAKRK